jgi:hypothetical protein
MIGTPKNLVEPRKMRTCYLCNVKTRKENGFDTFTVDRPVWICWRCYFRVRSSSFDRFAAIPSANRLMVAPSPGAKMGS